MPKKIVDGFVPYFHNSVFLMRNQLRWPSFSRIFKCLFFIGLACMIFLLGAAVMQFQLPMSDFLRKAFSGAKEFAQPPPTTEVDGSMDPAAAGIRIDKPAQTFDGFTLYTLTNNGPAAALVGMKGQVVHRWRFSFAKTWPEQTHVKNPLPDERQNWFGCHLFPNGDLLAVCHGEGTTPYGYGLVKLDKDSNVLWAYADNVHHEIDMAPDGKIYALTHKTTGDLPKGVNLPNARYIADSLVVLSAKGTKEAELPILEAFRDSKYSLWLTSIDQNHVVDRPPGPMALNAKAPPRPPTLQGPGPPPGAAIKFPAPSPAGMYAGFFNKGDYTHANSVRVVPGASAAKSSLFKEGQALISFRNLDTLAVVDIPSRSVIWASRGLWRKQHSPQFLENGHILLFDNLGDPAQSRVLEIDPVNQAIPWWYANENSKPFKATVRGAAQRLPNGNTLICDPDSRRIFEVTAGKEIVWDFVATPEELANLKMPLNSIQISTAQRFGEGELSFLKGVARARP